MKFVITTKTKLTLAIALVAAFSITIVGLVSFGVFWIISIQTAQKSLLTEAQEIVLEHIEVHPDRISFSTKDGAPTIEQDLLTDRYSALILNEKGELLGAFGIFEIKTVLLERMSPVTKKAVEQCVQVSARFEHQRNLADFPQELIYYPIVTAGQCRGIVVVAMNMTMINQIKSILFWTTTLLVLLLVSVTSIVSQKIAQVLLEPLVKLSRKMKEISVHSKPIALSFVSAPIHDELNQLISAYNDMIARVSEGSNKQREFISNASHELKGPLARLSSSLEVAELFLKRGDLEKSREYIASVRVDLLGLGEMVEMLLSAAQIKNSEMVQEKLLLCEVLQKNCDRLASLFQTKNLQVTVIGNKELIRCDVRIIDMIVQNCLLNAHKYSPVGGNIVLEIKQSTRTMTIKNNTVGDAQIEGIERFKRGKNTGVEKGYGLGLSIVRELAALMHAKVEILSEQELFTVIIADLPFVF